MNNDKVQHLRNEPKIRFEEFKDEWIQIQLGQVCNKPQYGMNSAATKFDGIHKYIRITDINENNNLFLPKPLVSPSGTLDDSFIVKENDILFTRTGASVGKSYIYNHEDGLLYYAGFLIRFNVRNYPSKFVFYQTQTHKYKNWVRVTSIRSGQPGINANEYSKFQFFMPKNQEESNKTSSFLSVIDSKINLLEEKLENLKLFKKGLTIQLINDSKKRSRSLKIKEFAKVVTGTTPPTKVHEYYGGGIAWVTPTDIHESMNIYDSKKKLTFDGLKKGRIIPNDSLLVTCIASIGKNTILKVDGSCNQQINAVLPSKMHNTEFLYHYIEISSRLLESYAGNGGMKMLSKSDFESIAINLPSIEKQNEIAITLSSFEKKIESSKEKIKDLKKFKKGLLQQMFV